MRFALQRRGKVFVETSAGDVFSLEHAGDAGSADQGYLHGGLLADT
jgi:hypothetical protein